MALVLAAQSRNALTGVPLQDWWWKARLGRCYYQLGLLREADQQFRSSMKAAMVTNTVLELSKASAQQP